VAYLLDTDIVSVTMRPRPNLGVVRRVATIPDAEQFISAVTLGELIFGATRRNRADLLERIRLLIELVPVVPFDALVAYRYGSLKAELEQAGTPLAEPDLRIAATALVHNLVLVTGNERHFRRVPDLTIENWLVSPEPGA